MHENYILQVKQMTHSLPTIYHILLLEVGTRIISNKFYYIYI